MTAGGRPRRHPNIMQPTLAQVSTLNSPFDADVADYAAGDCKSLEIWLGKLEGYLQSHSLDDVKKLLDEHTMIAPVASFQGGLFADPGDSRDAHWDHFHRRLAWCRDLEIGTLVIAADVPPPVSQANIERFRESLHEAAELAEPFNVRLALEFQSRSAFCNNLSTALGVVEDIARPNLGVCLDAFHFLTGASKTEDFQSLSPQNLFHVQLSDLIGSPRELALDADRVMPGDGEFPITVLVETLRHIGYSGAVSVELMNPQIWQVPARSFGEIAMAALAQLLAAENSSTGGPRTGR